MSFGPFPAPAVYAAPAQGFEDPHEALLAVLGLTPIQVQKRLQRRPHISDWSLVPKAAAVWYDDAVDDYRQLHSELKPGEKAWFDLEMCRRTKEDPDDPFVVPVYKAAEQTLASDIGEPVAQLMSLKRNPANNLLGGPTPLATALTGSALGAGIGYAGGAALENILPASLIERGRLRRTLGTVGGILGSTPGLYLGHLGAAADGTSWGEGMVSPGVLSGEKQADAGVQIGQIPVDMFNRVVLADPFTPPSVIAATAALTTAADRASGRTGLVTPFDLARIAVGAGAGYLQAYAGAKVLGGLAGLSPPAQRALQQAGVWAGALKSVVPGMFGL